MKYVHIDKNGNFNGVIFEDDQNLQAQIANYAQYGETLTPVKDVINKGTDEEPVWEIIPLEVEELRTMAVGLIAEKRWQKETAGIDVQGLKIPTDRDSQALITGAVVGAMLEPEKPINWKTSTLDEQGIPVKFNFTSEQFKEIGKIVRSHVQGWFDWETAQNAKLKKLKTIKEIQTFMDNLNIETLGN